MNYVEDEYRSLSGKTIAVTGASGYLGTHFVLNLVKQGAQVIAIDIDSKTLDVLKRDAQLNFPERKLICVHADLSQEAAVQSLATQIKKIGNLDGLVNNAAITTSPQFYDPLNQYQLDEWRRGFSVTVDGTFLMIKHLLPLMNPKSSIVNLGSIYGVFAPDQRIYAGSFREDIQRSINSPMVYSAAKGAVSMITRYLTGYLQGQSIRVNTLIPGGVERAQNDEFKNNYSRRVPMNRMGKPEEIAGALLFLLSESSSYITGQDFFVDGGLSAW